MVLFVLLGYIFTVWTIRSSIAELPNFPNLPKVTKCIPLPKITQRILFLPVPFSKEVYVFPVHTVVLTSLIHVGAIILVTMLIITSVTQLTQPQPDWTGSVFGGAVATWGLAWFIELYLLGLDKESQKPPKPPKLR